MSFKNPLGSRVYYGWWVLTLGCLIQVVGNGILYQCFTVFFLPLKRDLHLTSAAVSLLYGCSRLEGGVEGPIVGHFIDRLGARTMILIGAGMAGLGMIFLATVDSFLGLFLIYVFLVAFGFNCGFFHPLTAAVNKWFIRHRGLGFSAIQAAGGIGGMIMAPLLSYLILTYGWRTGAVVSGIMILAVSLPAALPIYRSPEAMGLHPDGDSPRAHLPIGLETEALELEKEVDYTVKEALHTFHYWLLTAAITLRITVTMALNVHFIPLLVWRGTDESTGAYLLSLYALCSVLTSIGMGWAGDRWNKAVLSSLGTLPLLVAMVALMSTSASLALYALPLGLAITMGTTPLNWALIGDFFGRHSYATLRGIMGVSYGVGTFFSPIYAGWIFDRTASYTLTLLTFSIILVIAFVLFAFLRRPSYLGEES